VRDATEVPLNFDDFPSSRISPPPRRRMRLCRQHGTCFLGSRSQPEWMGNANGRLRGIIGVVFNLISQLLRSLSEV